MTVRLASWWELPDGQQRQGRQGTIAMVRGATVPITCPECGQNPVVYNGNYFCDGWVYPGPPNPEAGECEWALPHPATRKRDREVCDLIGIDYL